MNENINDNEIIVSEVQENDELLAAEAIKKQEKKLSIIGLSSYIGVNYIIAVIIQIVLVIVLNMLYPNLFKEYQDLMAKFEELKKTGTAEQIKEMQTQVYHSLYFIKLIGLTNIFSSVVLFATTVAIFFKPLIREFKDLKKNAMLVLTTGFVGFFILLITSMITGLIATSISDSDDSINQMLIELICKNGYIIPMFFTTVIAAPIAEELVFRKCFFTLIKNKWLALIISSLVFGLIHVLGGGDFIFLINYAASGLVLGLIYIFAKKNIYASIIAHMLNNGFSYIMLVISLFLPQVVG